MYWDIVKWWTKHEGIDYAAKIPWQKIPCYSSVNWIVTFAWYSNWWWNHVYIQFDWYEIIYAHLDSITCKLWNINCFDEVWIIWTTWNSNWVHLHFWLRKIWGERIDPTQYITEREEKNATKTSHSEELNILIEDWLWNWELWNLDERMLVILSRVHKYAKENN